MRFYGTFNQPPGNTLMKEAGVSVAVAIQLLGNASLMVNQKHYAGVLTQQQRCAINSLPSVG